MTRNELKIVSGAQTGVDQGGLLAAIDLGLEWGGWVPKGWRPSPRMRRACSAARGGGGEMRWRWRR